jgi:glutamate synthase domain-containing protein 2
MVRRYFYLTSAALLAGIALATWWHPAVLWSLVVVGPLIAVGVHDVTQRRHALLRNYPVIGHGRYLMEAFRPEIQQYFVESNLDGRPFDREQRSLVYQRAKGETQAVPFGTQRDVYEIGHEWIAHSLAPRKATHDDPRVPIGGSDCKQPYRAAHLNVSAMSYGSLSKNAIRALNHGARQGGFFHNTGEGGLSPYHLEPGGDVCWQIGTGYFSCRAADGTFEPTLFAERAAQPSVKLVELKLSQGAKPSHGGILPAAKVSPEIAAIRGVPMGKDVLSPPAHSAFSTPAGLLEFIARLRELSGGKPVGFKLCVGDRVELLAICRAMIATGITPDFITVDGAEGGTGAAPVEFSNSVGTPLREGLLMVHNALVGIGVRDRIRVIASGKIVTGFDLVRAVALGADVCNAARGMMFALGCIQARRCHENSCPVGVATTDELLASALDVDSKAKRVASYQRATVHAFLELVGAAGLDNPAQIAPHHLWRRVSPTEVRHFSELYEYLPEGSLLGNAVPRTWREDWVRASADRFAAVAPSRARRLSLVSV